VLLIEAMAQSAGWLLIAMTKFERMAFLASVKEGKMRSFVNPGDLLTIDVRCLHEGSGYAVTEAKIRVKGELRSNATISFGVIPFPNPELRGHMDAMARRIGFPLQAATP
jgi:3-hydroxyacyl-[acyl-carrier-protein] dehydratase